MYFDATAPKFNASKFPFAERKPIPAPVVKMRMSGAAAGPRGFDLTWAPPRRHADGVARIPFDQLHPGNEVAWLDFEGEPLVRLGDLDTVDPGSAGVDVDEYLRATASRALADLGG